MAISPNVVVSIPMHAFTMSNSFEACANGEVYIGQIDTDPTIVSNQIPVYINNEGEPLIEVPQPILINSGGYPVYNGQIAKFVTSPDHSMAIYDNNNVRQFYFPNVMKYDPDPFRTEIIEYFGGDATQTLSPSVYKRMAVGGSGFVINGTRDAVSYNGLWYIFTGSLPHISTESNPTSEYKCVGLLNGWPINHTMNWAIDGGTSNHTASMQLMIKSLPADTTLISDGRSINIAGLDLTTEYPSVKMKGFRFAPFFSSGATSITTMFTVNRSGIVLEDVTIVKPPVGNTIAVVFDISDSLNLRFDRISCTGTAGTIGTFFKCTNMKESGFSNLRIDLDLTGRSGKLFESNYCVNNTISDCFVGFAENFIHCTTATHPSSSYASEGWLIDNVVAVYFNIPLYMQRVTSINVMNCIFDFCGNRFYEFTLGGYCMIGNCWFANQAGSSTTSPHAVVSGATFTGLTITSCSFINNNATNTTPLFSHNGNTSFGTKVCNNRSQGFSVGVILNASSVVFGNTFQNSGSTTYNVSAKSVVSGAGMVLENRPSWSANSTFFDLAFNNGIQSSGIRGVNSSISDRAGMDFYTTLAATQNIVFRLIDDNIITPRLPNAIGSTISNGLYAGTDGVVRINR